MLIESYLLVKQLEKMFAAGELKCQPVPAGSALSQGARYPTFCYWPESLVKATGKLKPAPAELRADLEALGVDAVLLNDEPLGFAWLIEPQTGSVTVAAVQAAVGKRGGIAIVCYPSSEMELVPELSWDAYEAIQKKIAELERTDPSWWTKKVALTLLIVVLVVGALLVGWFLLKHYHGKGSR